MEIIIQLCPNGTVPSAHLANVIDHPLNPRAARLLESLGGGAGDRGDLNIHRNSTTESGELSLNEGRGREGLILLNIFM